MIRTPLHLATLLAALVFTVILPARSNGADGIEQLDQAAASANAGDWPQIAQRSLEVNAALRSEVERAVQGVGGSADEIAQGVFQQLKDSRFDEAYQQALTIALAAASDTEVALRTAECVLNGKSLARQLVVERLREASAGRQEALLRQRPWITLAEVRESMPENSVLLEIERFSPRDFQLGTQGQPAAAVFAAWVIPKEEDLPVQIVRVGSAEQVDSLVARWRLLIRRAETGKYLDSSVVLRQLREKIIDQANATPTNPFLVPNRWWIVSPAAQLWLVPFSAIPLRDRTPLEVQSLGTSDPLFAIEEHAVSYVMSGRDLVLPARQPNERRALVVYNPAFDLNLAARATPGESIVRPASAVLPPVKRADAPPVVVRRTTRATAKNRLCPCPACMACRARQQARCATNGKGKDTTGGGAKRKPDGGLLSEEFTALSPELRRLGEKLTTTLAPSDPLQDERATEAKVTSQLQSSRYRQLVFLTHGFYYPTGAKDLLHCGLALAGAAQHDASQLNSSEHAGLLTSREIATLNLAGVDLAVLVACSSGRFEDDPFKEEIAERNLSGAGMASVRHAFLLAGVNGVVASGWKVNEAATTELMTHYFNHLDSSARPLDRHLALHQAQLDLIQSLRTGYGSAHPFYWAAFSFTGNWRNAP